LPDIISHNGAIERAALWVAGFLNSLACPPTSFVEPIPHIIQAEAEHEDGREPAGEKQVETDLRARCRHARHFSLGAAIARLISRRALVRPSFKTLAIASV
jgi:hypothetical protein